MCNNFPNIKVVRGNAFALLMPLKKRTFESCEPIDEDIDATQLTDLVVKFGGVQYQASTSEDGVQIIIPADIAVGTYSIVLTAMYQGSAIRAAYESAVTIVDYNSQSDAQQFVPGSPIVCDAAYVIGGALTDAELEQLKEEYREKNAQLDQAIADAEEAKREWEQKAAELDDVAQESTSQDILTAVGDIHIDTSDLAKEATLQGVGADAAAAKTAAQNAETAAGQAKTAATNAYASAEAAKTAAEALPSLNQIVSGIIDSVSIPFNLGGVVLEGASPSTAAELFANMDKVVSITDTESISMKQLTITDFPILKKLSLYAMTTYTGGNYFMRNAAYLEEVDFPHWQVGTSYGFLMQVPNLKRANFKYSNKAVSSQDAFLGLCPNLIDVECGVGFVASTTFLVNWIPTTALSNSDTSLLTPEDIAAGFTSNLEKLLYNIREHIAANLPDRTGQSALTLSMSAAVKAAILADAATLTAFTNKNWTIA